MSILIGCDYHPSFQQLAMLDTGTGERRKLRVVHEGEAARRFYAALPAPARIGMEATGNARWFERLLAELGHELWIGDPAKIRASVVRQQKTDERDAEQLLQLLEQQRFPRLWVPSEALREARQLLLHRHKLVQMRTRVKNELQHLAMNQGLRQRRRLWSPAGRQQLLALPLGPWAARRREDLLQLLDHLQATLAPLDAAIAQEAARWPQVALLRTHPGVGAIVALAFVVTVGTADRFAGGKQVASYFGLIPRERSSGGRQKLGSISKQGNSFVRWLLVEAAQTAARRDPEWKRFYLRLALRKHRSLAKVAVARRLAVRLYWMLRQNQSYAQLQLVRMQGSPIQGSGGIISPRA